MRGWADGAAWFEIAAASLVLNVGTVIASVCLWRLLIARRTVDDAVRRVDRRDVRLTASTTLVNAAVALPAWWLWREGIVEIDEPSVVGVVADTVVLLVGLDLSMYVLHRVFHQGVLYRWFHAWHHTGDERMTPVTLCVMHPFEAAGFGLATLGLMWSSPVSVPAVLAFFTINLIVGTVAQVPRSDDPAAVEPTVGWFGGSSLHAGHHARPDTNFGFFTQVWDRLLGTRV